jgi:hypothetical protein
LTKAGTAVTKLTTPLANTARGIADGSKFSTGFSPACGKLPEIFGGYGALGVEYTEIAPHARSQ